MINSSAPADQLGRPEMRRPRAVGSPFGAVVAVRDARGIPGHLKPTLIVLATYYPDIRPGVDTLALDLGVDTRSVRRRLRELEGLGLISTRQRGNGRTASRTIDFDQLATFAARTPASYLSSESSPDTSVPPVEREDASPDTSVTPARTPASPEESREESRVGFGTTFATSADGLDVSRRALAEGLADLAALRASAERAPRRRGRARSA